MLLGAPGLTTRSKDATRPIGQTVGTLYSLAHFRPPARPATGTTMATGTTANNIKKSQLALCVCVWALEISNQLGKVLQAVFI